MYNNKAQKTCKKKNTQKHSTKYLKGRSKSKIIPELVKFTMYKATKNVT